MSVDCGSCTRRSCKRASGSWKLQCESCQPDISCEANLIRTEPEGSIEDAVCAVVYAAPRTELKELQVLREIIMHKVSRTLRLECDCRRCAKELIRCSSAEHGH